MVIDRDVIQKPINFAEWQKPVKWVIKAKSLPNGFKGRN